MHFCLSSSLYLGPWAGPRHSQLSQTSHPHFWISHTHHRIPQAHLESHNTHTPVRVLPQANICMRAVTWNNAKRPSGRLPGSLCGLALELIQNKLLENSLGQLCRLAPESIQNHTPEASWSHLGWRLKCSKTILWKFPGTTLRAGEFDSGHMDDWNVVNSCSSDKFSH